MLLENNSTEKSSTEPESQIFKLAEKALVNNLSKTSSKVDKRTGISRTGPLQPLSVSFINFPTRERDRTTPETDRERERVRMTDRKSDRDNLKIIHGMSRLES